MPGKRKKDGLRKSWQENMEDCNIDYIQMQCQDCQRTAKWKAFVHCGTTALDKHGT